MVSLLNCNGRRRRDARRLMMGMLLAGALLTAASCGRGLPRVTKLEESCAQRRLSAAEISFEDAKEQFVQHFKLRSDTALRFAYQASLDSTRLASSIRSCFDFDRTYVQLARDLIRSNRILRRLVRTNLRDTDPQRAIGVFGDRYREIFKNDIN